MAQPLPPSRIPRARRALALALLLTSLAAAPPGGATVLRSLSFDEQCVGADRIFVGAVRALESRWNPRAPRYIETLVTFTVEDVVAGRVPAEIVLRFSGGTIGAERQSIDDLPEFAIGERYVVFVEAEQEPPLTSPVTGFNQGLYRVVEVPAADAAQADAPSQEAGQAAIVRAGRQVIRDRRGQALNERAPGVAARVAELAASPPRAEETDLAAFLAAIRAARRR